MGSVQKIVQTNSNEVDSHRSKRRYYSPQLKAEVMQQCRQSSASVASVALTHGINANIVRRVLTAKMALSVAD